MGSADGRVIIHVFTFWYEKISLDNDERWWVVECVRQSKKDNGQFDLPHEGGKSKIGSLHGVPARREKTLVPWMCGYHAIENFWSIFLSRQTILDLNRYGKDIWDANPTFSFPLSLILRECGHHELSIVLTANFSAATGEESIEWKWSDLHSISSTATLWLWQNHRSTAHLLPKT